jgi:hypothetical protein
LRNYCKLGDQFFKQEVVTTHLLHQHSDDGQRQKVVSDTPI